MFLFTQQYWNEEHEDLFWAAVGSFVVVNIIATVLLLWSKGSDCCLFFPLLIFVFAGNFLLPIGKPLLLLLKMRRFVQLLKKIIMFQSRSA